LEKAERHLKAPKRYEDRPNIFLSAFFRSGSTHVKITLIRLLGYRPASTVISVGNFGNDSHQINHNAAQILFPLPAQVFHQHTLGTNGTQTLCELYKLRPVIMFRNILDSMVSLRELLATGENQHLGIYYPPWFCDWTKEEQFEWIARNVTNWYCVFYLSWMQTELPVHYIHYDDFYADQVQGIRKILEHTGVDKFGHVTDEVIDQFTKPFPGGRLNVGRSGRGKEQMPEWVIRIVREQMASWGDPWVNRMIDELIER
jgi:hypothetical protein